MRTRLALTLAVVAAVDAVGLCADAKPKLRPIPTPVSTSESRSEAERASDSSGSDCVVDPDADAGVDAVGAEADDCRLRGRCTGDIGTTGERMLAVEGVRDSSGSTSFEASAPESNSAYSRVYMRASDQ